MCTVSSIYTSYAMNMHSMKIAAQKVNFFKERDREKISLSPSPNFPDIKQLIVTASVCFPHSLNFKIKFILLNRNYIISRMPIEKEKCSYSLLQNIDFFPYLLEFEKILFKFRKKDYPYIGLWYLKLATDTPSIIPYRENDKMRNYSRWNIAFKIFAELFGSQAQKKINWFQ